MNVINADAELDLFKTTPIATFLPALGWHPTKNKDEFQKGKENIETFKGRGGIYRYKDENKKFGTILDLALIEVGAGKFGDARRLLRSILGNQAPENFSTKPLTQNPSSLPPVPSTESSQVPQVLQSETINEENKKMTYAEAKAVFEAGSLIWSDPDFTPNLMRRRGLHSVSEIHRRSMRLSGSGSGNIRFPYFVRLDDGEIVHGGHETIVLHGGGKRYQRGTHNGVWRSSGPHIMGKTAVVGESPLDVLAYDGLHPCDEGRHLFALRSGTEVMCIDMIRDMIDQDLIDTVIIVTDNDPAGMVYAGKALTRLQVGRDKTLTGPARKYYKGVRAYYHAPDGFREDWNDVVKPVESDDSPSP
ncbi:toprim domain-containing protein [Sulfitobacter guttiformis]|uniref:Toprim domain-containing protein n=1 Tax=Sulfitobacter guttiformis TaxID=74349 RepID=A0A420DHA9_9RHOB|nr:toprim domain-containing protein [Sulfitobacter guttiformis]KIN72660.1 hypothetical protein Z949_1838 [Sulfitobacter guttiformis KCTC 32187]RKE93611.1 Toprim domain-containing protein [Sulfitobacter guttiformis]